MAGHIKSKFGIMSFTAQDKKINATQLEAQTGRILAREGAAIPTNPSLRPGLWKTTLVTALPKNHCQTPTSFSGIKTFPISMDPDMKLMEPAVYLDVSSMKHSNSE